MCPVVEGKEQIPEITHTAQTKSERYDTNAYRRVRQTVMLEEPCRARRVARVRIRPFRKRELIIGLV